VVDESVFERQESHQEVQLAAADDNCRRRRRRHYRHRGVDSTNQGRTSCFWKHYLPQMEALEAVRTHRSPNIPKPDRDGLSRFGYQENILARFAKGPPNTCQQKPVKPRRL